MTKSCWSPHPAMYTGCEASAQKDYTNLPDSALHILGGWRTASNIQDGPGRGKLDDGSDDKQGSDVYEINSCRGVIPSTQSATAHVHYIL